MPTSAGDEGRGGHRAGSAAGSSTRRQGLSCSDTLLRTRKISLEQVVAVGDGANDLPMLNLAGMGIAFRAKPLVRQSADHSLTHLGLDGLLYLIGVRDRDLVGMGYSGASAAV